MDDVGDAELWMTLVMDAELWMTLVMERVQSYG